METDVWSLAVDLHGFFKISTSRREDILDISALFEDETDLFFLRPVNTRWLSTEPVLERIANKWKTITQCFCTFVKNSTHQNKRTARNTARYQRIVEFLEPATNAIMYTTICWAIHLAKKTKTYLMMFQKEGPMVHMLWSQSCFLIKEIMEMFHNKAT